MLGKKMLAKPFGLSVNALIDDGNGCFLLLKRSKESKFFSGQWEPPGGKINIGEPFDSALLREIEEETGLTISLEGVAGISEFELPHIRVAQIYMRAHLVSGQVQLGEEHDDYVWLPLSEFGTRNITPGLRNVLPRLELNG